MRGRQLRLAALLAGGVAMVLGSFLPWGSALGVPQIGVATIDGWFTLISGSVLVALCLQRTKGLLPAFVGWVAAFNGTGLAIINYFDIIGTEGLSVGIGMWIMLAGSVLALVGLLMGRKKA